MKKVTVLGCGNWGTTVAKIVGENLPRIEGFDKNVYMWVFEETVRGRKLSEIINTDHENTKYLPGIKLPHNVVAEPDLIKSISDADFLLVVLPHQFVPKTMKSIAGKVKPDVCAVNFAKGLLEGPSGCGIVRISEVVQETLKLDMCASMIGANVASEIARGLFSEGTIGCRDLARGLEIKRLLERDYFRLAVVEDEAGVELCGALKNVVALGAGFSDGLGYEANTKAAILRLGLMEMIHIIQHFYPGSPSSEAMLGSCGLADLIATSFGGRNRRVAEAFVRTGKPIEQLETELLDGQKLQGPPTARELYTVLHKSGIDKHYPIFSAVHKILAGEMPATHLVDALKNHPEHFPHHPPHFGVVPGCAGTCTADAHHHH